MKKNWLIVGAVSALALSACKDKSSETTYSNKDSSGATSTYTETTPPPTTTPEYNPPDNVRTAFQSKYPNATSVTWSPYKAYDRLSWEWTGWPSMDSSYYAVNYSMDNKSYMGWYNKNSTWIGATSTLTDSTMLPDPVKKAITKNFPGYKIVSMEEENDMKRTAYEIRLEKAEAKAKILIDKNGKILKRATGNDADKPKNT